MKPYLTRPTLHRTPLHAVALAAALAMAAPAGAQDAALAFSDRTLSRAAAVVEEGSALARGRYAVVIDLDRNELFFKRGDLTLWSAPVGTGSGLRLQADDAEWEFSTPNGSFQVQYKEQDPVWIAPDWYFVENGLPVPGEKDKARRRFPGGLGAAAVFIQHDLAIHGTNKPELLGQRVSHGCIRLSNKDALRLFHNVQVGTEVIIVGGEDIPQQVVTPEDMMRAKAKNTFDPSAGGPPRDRQLEEWKALGTTELVTVLENELWLNDQSTRWPEVANLLLDRGVEDGDDDALAGLMSLMAELPTSATEREYATFLADAFGRSAQRTLIALAGLQRDARERAAHAIVEATMNLYPGDFDAPGAPWPTARIPRSTVEPEARDGWELLAEAERRFRTPRTAQAERAAG